MMIPHPPFSSCTLDLTSYLLRQIKGESHRESWWWRCGSDEMLLTPPLLNLRALWWRWEWAEVLSQSAVTLRWELASETLCLLSEIKAPPWDTCRAAGVKIGSCFMGILLWLELIHFSKYEIRLYTFDPRRYKEFQHNKQESSGENAWNVFSTWSFI